MEKIFKHKDKEFTITKWTMKKQLEKQNSVLPVISGPLTTAIAYSDLESESYTVAAVVSGLIDSLAEVNMAKFCAAVLDEVTHKNENGVPQMTTLDTLEKLEFEASDVYILLAAVIKVNYEGLLKNDLQDSLTALMEL